MLSKEDLRNLCKSAQVAPTDSNISSKFAVFRVARALLSLCDMETKDTVYSYESVLYARAVRLLRSHTDAWDLVQDTYERALRGFSGYEPGTNLRFWLMTIMHNLFLDRCRRKSREPRSSQLDHDDVASPEPYAPEPWESITTEQINSALADLERPFREVYELRLLGNCSYDEIADRLTIPRSTVGTRLMRARHKLRASLLKQAS